MERVVKALNSVQSPLHWATFAGLMAIAVILRLAAFQGYYDSDPRLYLELANNWRLRANSCPDLDVWSF
jgi:hypothetical protein